MKAVPRNRYIAFVALAASGCFVDLVTKAWIFARMGMPHPNQPSHWLIENIFGFTISLNEGALFGFGQGFSLLFAALSVGAAVGILVWLYGLYLLTLALCETHEYGMSKAALTWLLPVIVVFVLVASLAATLIRSFGLASLMG